MDQQAPAADIFGELDDSGEDILQEARAESSVLVVDVHAEPRQQRDRLRDSAPPPY